MAIGAQRADVVRSFVGEGLLLTALGLALGGLGALAVTRLLTTLLFGVTPTDGPTFAAMAALLGLTAVAACYVPARRAANVDPLTALRRQ
jgi:putative ABC transport system permease protein